MEQLLNAPRGAIWAAEIFAWLIEGYQNLCASYVENREAAAKQEVIKYALSIRHSDPTLSNELIALASKDRE